MTLCGQYKKSLKKERLEEKQKKQQQQENSSAQNPIIKRKTRLFNNYLVNLQKCEWNKNKYKIKHADENKNINKESKQLAKDFELKKSRKAEKIAQVKSKKKAADLLAKTNNNPTKTPKKIPDSIINKFKFDINNYSHIELDIDGLDYYSDTTQNDNTLINNTLHENDIILLNNPTEEQDCLNFHYYQYIDCKANIWRIAHLH